MKPFLKVIALFYGFLLFGLLGLFCINRYYDYKHKQVTELVREKEDLKGIMELLGEPMYSTDSGEWSHEWINESFSVNIDREEAAYVFHPQGTWSNFLLIIVIDDSGGITRVLPRRT